MGVAGSALIRKITRPLKTFNVEERAMKVISRDKPTAAPPHPAMKKVMEDIMRDPSKLKIDRTDPRLLENLSQVYLTSKGDNPEITGRRMPVERTPPEENPFGYGVPKVIPPGRASLSQLIEIIANHSDDAEKWPPEKIAKDYNLDIVDVMNLVQYYKTLLIVRPPKPTPGESKPALRRLQDGIDNLKH